MFTNMNKKDQIIIAVDRHILFGKSVGEGHNGADHFEGFRPHHEIDYENRILSNIKHHKRGDIEEDPSLQQPICYNLIVNPTTKKVFAYQRADNKNADESRLWGKWSWGVGGHVEKKDTKGNPLRESSIRETEEEVQGLTNASSKIIGYVNSEANDVDAVHFCILYLVETDAIKLTPLDKEIAKGEFFSLSELEDIGNSKDCEVENWSKIALNPLKQYFSTLK